MHLLVYMDFNTHLSLVCIDTYNKCSQSLWKEGWNYCLSPITLLSVLWRNSRGFFCLDCRCEHSHRICVLFIIWLFLQKDISEEVSGFRRTSYSLLKRQEAGFIKTGSRTLQISIIFFFVQILFLLRKKTTFVPETDQGWKHKQSSFSLNLIAEIYIFVHLPAIL